MGRRLEELAREIVEHDKKDAEEIRAKILANNKKSRRRSIIFYSVGLFCFSTSLFLGYLDWKKHNEFRNSCNNVVSKYEEKYADYNYLGNDFECYKFSFDGKDAYIIPEIGLLYSNGDKISTKDLVE